MNNLNINGYYLVRNIGFKEVKHYNQMKLNDLNMNKYFLYDLNLNLKLNFLKILFLLKQLIAIEFNGANKQCVFFVFDI